MKRILILLPVLVALLAVGCTAKAYPTPDVYDTGIDPDSWVLVPAGEFLMQQWDDSSQLGRPGVQLYDLDYDYEIMVTPVTNAQYATYLNAALAAGTIKIATADKVVPDGMEPYQAFEYNEGDVIGEYPGDVFEAAHHELEIVAGWYLHVPLNDEKGDLRLVYDGDTFSVETGYDNHPVTVVTWFGAKAYCEFYGGRLPTDAEWEKAARGTDGRPFPWGDEIEKGNANFYNSGDPFEQYSGIGKLGLTTPVGFYNGRTYDGYETLDSPSPYGVYDMAGNVWEWTDAKFLHYRVLRGGAKSEYERRLRVWTIESARPDYYSPNAGFRSVRPVSD